MLLQLSNCFVFPLVIAMVTCAYSLVGAFQRLLKMEGISTPDKIMISVPTILRLGINCIMLSN